MTTITAPVALITPEHPPQPARSDDERRVRTALKTERRERAMQRSALLMLPPR